MLSGASTSAFVRRVGRVSRPALSLGVGVPLLLSSTPAAAAGAAGVGLGAATTAFGLAATLWALLAVRGAVAGGAAVAALLVLFAFAVAFTSWPALARRVALAWPPRHRANPLGPAPHLDLPMPAGIDGQAVLADARGRFMRLQAAWDARDLQALRHLTMPDVYEDLRDVMSAIESPFPLARTDVVTLDASLLALEEADGAWLASVEFSGLIRESGDADAVPFRELWMLAADKCDEPAWRLARQQALL